LPKTIGVRKSTLVILLLFAALSCRKDDESNVPSGIDFRQEMRDFVIGISQYAKSINSGFVVIPQNGIELVTDDGNEDGNPNSAYLAAIDGNGQEDLFYGYENDDVITPAGDNLYLRAFLNISKNAGNKILVTDYCSTQSKMSNSYSQNYALNYISFAADHRELDNIPSFPNPIYNSNSQDIFTLADAKNFLYLINPQQYAAKADFINAIAATNYDMLIIDLFFNDGVTSFTSEEITELRVKANGGQRLVIAYLSIGEVEDYRYYWQSNWSDSKPAWIAGANPDWPGNYKVWYWEKEWQDIIFGNDSSYLKRILDAGFDGVYLDIIDAFEYYE